MSSWFHLKLAAGILLVFGLLITSFALWIPLKTRYYESLLNSDKPEDRIAAVEALIALGEDGKRVLRKKMSSDEEVEYFIRKFSLIDESASWNDFVCHHDFLQALHRKYYFSIELLMLKGLDINRYYGPNDFGNCWTMEVAAIYPLIIPSLPSGIMSSPKITPLQWAAWTGDREMLVFLIKCNARVNAPSGYLEFSAISRYSGPTALGLAEKAGHKSISALIRKHGGKTIKEIEAEKKTKSESEK